MPLSINNWGLYTDFYELTMAQGYFFCGKKDESCVFDYFFRVNPFKGGFTVFAGLEDFITLLSGFNFNQSDLQYLAEQGFQAEFLDYLRNFRFNGMVFSVQEGEIIFPNEPVMRVEGNIIECQLIESLLLNIINYQSLIATKSFRIKEVAGNRPYSDFGLRRAQGFGSIHGSRAAAIGGAASTSNVMAGKLYNINLSGTQAHSWIQSFDNELDAFRAFVQTNPANSILLVDTYNSLKSGIPNAITVAKEMEKKGQRLKAVRLDSGDLAYLSKRARKMLDEAGLEYVKIIASNQLNEFVIKSLLKDQNASIDFFGVGTELITGKENASLDGVYKLAEANGKPKMKISDNLEKVTLPGKKQVFRCVDSNGMFYRDAILLHNEASENVEWIYHPVYAELNTHIKNLIKEPLLKPVIEKGQRLTKQKSTEEIHQYLIKRAAQLPDEHKRFISPHLYKVGISQELRYLRDEMTGSLK